jgi:polysaccharide biosynthesis/export protein
MPPRWCQSPSHSQQNFNILGQVQHPGTFPLTHPVTVLDAIALAGGFRDFAKTKSIYVLRQKPDGTWSRLAFNYKEAIRGNSPAQNTLAERRFERECSNGSA